MADAGFGENVAAGKGAKGLPNPFWPGAAPRPILANFEMTVRPPAKLKPNKVGTFENDLFPIGFSSFWKVPTLLTQIFDGGRTRFSKWIRIDLGRPPEPKKASNAWAAQALSAGLCLRGPLGWVLF